MEWRNEAIEGGGEARAISGEGEISSMARAPVVLRRESSFLEAVHFQKKKKQVMAIDLR
jgi:hypothetical protein